ncbi:MAG: hypothetical protein GF375_05305 [Candidatus Omnitrophica bacterium]|nr:hypothetical protein [Candidatus Omnitrophota bacterium]
MICLEETEQDRLVKDREQDVAEVPECLAPAVPAMVSGLAGVQEEFAFVRIARYPFRTRRACPVHR